MLEHQHRAFVSILLVVSLTLAGCAGAVGPDGKPRSALERSIGTCLVSIGAGILFDMLANKKRIGAGTAVGAGVCAVVLVLNNEEDKQRVRQAELRAYEAGKDSEESYVGQDNRTRFVKVAVHPVDMPTSLNTKAADGSSFVGPCRRTQTSVTVQGQGTADLGAEVVCRTNMGDWLPATGQAI
jgi:hypothetical protein